MVQRAVERGDITDPPDTDLIAAVLPAMVFHQITALNAPVDRDYIIAVIDHLVLPALRGG
jgi:hypothetical protein